jgi:uncharacterized protein YegJ (DUF2314 family)
VSRFSPVVVLALLAVATIGVGCRKETASRVTTADPAPGPPPGELLQALRPVELAVYLSSPAPPALLEQLRTDARARLPSIVFQTVPLDGTGGRGLISAPALSSFAPPTRAQLDSHGRGLTSAQAEQAAASQGVVRLSLVLDGDPGGNQLRAAELLMGQLARDHAGYVWDEETRELFSVDQWQTTRAATWEGDLPDAHGNVVIHTYEVRPGQTRSITLGMAKLGLPDLVVQEVAPSQTMQAAIVLDALAQALVEGARPDDHGSMKVDVDALHHARARSALARYTRANATRRIELTLSTAPLEQGDARNRLLALSFPAFAGASAAERQAGAIAAFAGRKEDEVAAIRPDDPELVAAQQRVQARLPTLAATFRAGLPAGERLSVKAPFATDDDSEEWLWLDVSTWRDDSLDGTLISVPERVASLKLGAKVRVSQGQVGDYVWSGAGGKRKEGGELDDILAKRTR